MCLRFQRSMKAIQHMAYMKNDHATSGERLSGHENAVAQKLVAQGFKEEKKEDYPHIAEQETNQFGDTGNASFFQRNFKNMPKGSFIAQPCGSQDFPDFLIRDFDGRFWLLECKSNKGVSPTWNDHLPRLYAIYVYCSAKTNQTTIFLGKDVITAAMHVLAAEFKAKLKLLTNEYKPLFKDNDDFVRGFLGASRPQFQQRGKKITNYFTHPDRAKCEANVLSAVK